MKRLLFLFILLNAICISSCTLTGDQENKLNNQLNNYIKAYNKRNTLFLTALTHHSVVDFYLNDSIESFDIHFNPTYDSIRTYYDNPMNRGTEANGKYIQRKYTVEKYTELKEINPEYAIFALSEDKGNTWFFVNETDYFNPKIPLKRLFKK